jgi:hypothetical protein
MRTSWLILLGCLALAGCGEPGGAPLVSAQYPPATGEVNSHSEPQPLNSLPVGAANLGTAPGAVQGNYLSWTFGAR